MKTLTVERLAFSFGKSWRIAEKWDDSTAYRDGIQRVQGKLDGSDEGTKAVDIIAVDDNRLVLVEVKDFRPRRSSGTSPAPSALAYGGRWKSVPLEIALKVRDTLAALVGVALGTDEPLASAIRDRLTTRVRILACLVQERRPAEPDSKRKIREKQMRDSMRQKLAWLGLDVHVFDPLLQPALLPALLPDVSVTTPGGATTSV